MISTLRAFCGFVANWAQGSGYIEQNVVIPQQPTLSHPHWQARYGMSTAVILNVCFKTLDRYYHHSSKANEFCHSTRRELLRQSQPGQYIC